MADRERSRTPDPPAPAPAPATDDSGAPEAAPAPPAENGGGDNGGGGGSGEPSGDEVKLYVGNLDYATNEDRLRQEFGQFGTVTDVFLPVERGTQRPRGFGFVTMSQRSEAENAISKMDQSQLDGRTIRVNESRPRGSAPPGGGGGGRGGGGGFNAQGKEEVSVCLIMFFLFRILFNFFFNSIVLCFYCFFFKININRSNSTWAICRLTRWKTRSASSLSSMAR